MLQQLADDAHHLIRCLARSVDGFRHPLTQRTMVIHQRVTDITERQPPKRGHCIVGREAAGTNAIEQLTDVGLVHGRHATARIGEGPVPAVP